MNTLGAIGYPLLAVAMLNFGMGTFLLARRASGRTARYAAALALVNALYSWVIGTAYVRASYGLPYDLYYRSAWVGWVGLAPLAQIIFSLKERPDQARWWGRLLYAMWGTIWILCLTTDLFEGGAVSLVPFVDRVGWLERPARATGALMLCWALYELYRVQRASAGRRRQEIAYFLVGLAIYATAGLLLAGLLQLAGGVRFDPGLVSYFSVAWMAFTFYAITRHRLFDIRFVVSRTLLAVVLTALLVALQVALFQWTAPLVGPSAGIAIVSVVSGILLFTTPLITRLERRAVQLLVPRRFDYQRAMKESVRMLASLGTVDAVLGQLLGAMRDTIGSTCATLLLREGDAFRRKQSYGAPSAPPGLPVDSPLVGWLGDRSVPFVREEQERRLSSISFQALIADLQPFDGEVAVAMRYRDAVLGILIVGPKADKDAFLQADIDLLETLANEAAIAVTNARLVEELQQAVRARDDFVSVAGHELRTPLNGLHLNMQLVMRMLPDDAPVRDRLRIAERQVARLTRLMEDLLDASRITAGRMTLEREPIELGGLVHEIAARFNDEIDRCGSTIDIAVSEPVVGQWDRLRVEQIVSNLLSNAVKYGDGKSIAIAVERDGALARIIVRDHGIGIAAGDQGRIFDRFERAATANRTGGFGLGLWITKQIVEAHGGAISVTSSPGTGSTFRVDLPLG